MYPQHAIIVWNYVYVLIHIVMLHPFSRTVTTIIFLQWQVVEVVLSTLTNHCVASQGVDIHYNILEECNALLACYTQCILQPSLALRTSAKLCTLIAKLEIVVWHCS